MKKLMLEALAACLASAAVCGQARAAIQTGEVATPYSDGKVPANGSIRASADVALLTSAATDRSGTRLATRVNVPADKPFRVEALQSSAAFGFSLPGADDLSPGSKNGYANDGGQLKVIQSVRNEDSEAAKLKLIAGAKLAPGATTLPVPEPGSWATLLAGLLGVIAIARRRMSL